jgi:hypothetical protein
VEIKDLVETTSWRLKTSWRKLVEIKDLMEKIQKLSKF